MHSGIESTGAQGDAKSSVVIVSGIRFSELNDDQLQDGHHSWRNEWGCSLVMA